MQMDYDWKMAVVWEMKTEFSVCWDSYNMVEKKKKEKLIAQGILQTVLWLFILFGFCCYCTLQSINKTEEEEE